MPSHDEIVAQALEAVKHADPDAIVRAFVGSLSTRNLPARSAFGSYVVLQRFEIHPYRRSEVFSTQNCALCGVPPETENTSNTGRPIKIVEGYPIEKLLA